ncbi:unnamed protein product [Adineta ricciae]|uniref:Uncharacterized protein n=1 Tax=Adineta ricciae TaxID=249248 RepID=A0A814AFT6_ADIRI|nr:unnamed protein product [Adineta ricciae]CAF0946452.1 unnamed protein product [Adineta ricciae]
MLALTLFVFLTIGVSMANSHACTCCFPNMADVCQTMAIDLVSCDECTNVFCANHVKGCQGLNCKAICQPDTSSSSTTLPSSSFSSKTSSPSSSTFSSGSRIQWEPCTISISSVVLVFLRAYIILE